MKEGVDFSLGIYNNASPDIEQINFGFLGLKFLKLESADFKDFVLSTSALYTADHNYQVFHDFYQTRNSGSRPYLYALLPLDLNSAILEETFHNLETVFLVALPS